MEKVILNLGEIIKILKRKGYSAKIHEDNKTVIVKDVYNGGNWFFSGEEVLKELVEHVLKSG